MVITINNFLSKDECESLLKFSLQNELQPGLTGLDSQHATKYRESNILFYDYSLDFPNLNKKLIEIFEKEIDVKGHKVDFMHKEFQFTEYKTNGYYNWHTDSSSPSNKERYCSIVIQLNDSYTGGELQLKNNDNTDNVLNSGLGNLFLFHSHIQHRVTPVLTGIRYSLVNWIKLIPIKNYKRTLI
jgi:PKHD-type hydroxylase